MSKKNKDRSTVVSSLVDIVIPVHNGYGFFGDCLNSIPNAVGNIPYTVYMYDGGSKPEARDEFYRQHPLPPNYKLSKSPQNRGYPGGCNTAAGYGRSPLIFILTTDVILKPHAIEHLVMSMDDPKVGVAGMKLLFPENTPHGPSGKVQHVGLSVNIRGEIIHHLIGWSPDNPKTCKSGEVFATTGAAFITRRNLWQKIKGFNTAYGLGTYEDCEYCVKVRDLGYNIIVNTDAIATHFVSRTSVEVGAPFALGQNRNTFMAHCGDKLIYDEWKHW